MIQRNKKGFTIVELMLAMTAVSLLMVSIAVLTIFIKNIMVRGNTYRELNSASRAINDSFSRSFSSITLKNWKGGQGPGDDGQAYFIKTPRGGAFCTGSFSYLWNDDSALAENSTSRVPVRYSGTDEEDKSIRMVKVVDNSMYYCYPSPLHRSLIWEGLPRDSTVTEIIPAGETNLMLYDIDFKLIDRDIDTGQSIVNISYTLGTGKGEKQISADNASCRPNSEENYCAINNFNVTVRTIGR